MKIKIVKRKARWWVTRNYHEPHHYWTREDTFIAANSCYRQIRARKNGRQ